MIEYSAKRAHRSEPPERVRAPAAVRPARARARRLLALQRRVGNQAVRRVLAEVTDEPAPDGVAARIEAARGGGRPLDEPLRSRMEAGFGVDLSAVRVHTGPEAGALSRSLDARAFALGPDVFFTDGAYAPGSSAGRRLVAHELAHVVQQDDAAPQGQLMVGSASGAAEQEADALADEVMQRETALEPEREDEEHA